MDNVRLFYKGRVALFTLLKVFGVGPGDRVLLPGYTCIVVPFAIRYLGAIPEYADIDPASYNPQLHQYQEAYSRLVSQGLESTLKAVIIQHTYGNPNRDTESIVAWAKQYSLWVIEDCAHACGVTINGRSAGSLGDGAFFSTQWSKPLTTGLGGVAQINHPQYRNALHQLSAEAQSPSIRENIMLALQVAAHTAMYRPSFYWLAVNTHRALAKAGLFIGSSTTGELNGEIPKDYYKSMGPLQRWLLRRRSAAMAEVNRHRRQLAADYDKLLAARSIQPFTREESAILTRYPVRVKNKRLCLEDAQTKKVEIGDWFNHPLHPEGSNLEQLNWDSTLFPESARAARETINLPVHLRINSQEAKRIADFIGNYV